MDNGKPFVLSNCLLSQILPQTAPTPSAPLLHSHKPLLHRLGDQSTEGFEAESHQLQAREFICPQRLYLSPGEGVAMAMPWIRAPSPVTRGCGLCLWGKPQRWERIHRELSDTGKDGMGGAEKGGKRKGGKGKGKGGKGKENRGKAWGKATCQLLISIGQGDTSASTGSSALPHLCQYKALASL